MYLLKGSRRPSEQRTASRWAASSNIEMHRGKMMFHIDDPDEMTPAERFREIAWILAAGFLRLGGPGSVIAASDSDDLEKSEVHHTPEASERPDIAGVTAT